MVLGKNNKPDLHTVTILIGILMLCCAVQCHISLIDSQFDSSNELIASAKKYSPNMFCYHRGSTESRLCECNLHDNQFSWIPAIKHTLNSWFVFLEFFFFFIKSYVIVDIITTSAPCMDSPGNLKITGIGQWNFGRRIKLSQ